MNRDVNKKSKSFQVVSDKGEIFHQEDKIIAKKLLKETKNGETRFFEVDYEFPLVNLPRISAPRQKLRYRLIETVLAAMGLIISSPVFLAVTLALKLQRKGEIFYSQVRVGLNGKEFKIYKFQTMFPDAEVQSGPFICDNYEDKRITPLGKILRKTKIDELPQLYNVLKGDMSFVGPRPERPHFHNQHVLTIKNWEQRILVKPGITGLAQISQVIAHDPELKILADNAYIRHRSIALEIKILFLTIFPKFLPKKLKEVPMKLR